MRSGGDNIAGDRAELEVLQRQFRFTSRFRLEVHLEQGTGAGHTLSVEPAALSPVILPAALSILPP